MSAPGGFAELPRDVLKIIVLLTANCSTAVRASICCKGWQACMPPNFSDFWRSLYEKAKCRVAVLPRVTPDPTKPPTDQIDWFSACSYQGRVLYNVTKDRIHMRILDVTPMETEYRSSWSFYFSPGHTRLAITLIREMDCGSYMNPVPHSSKVMSIETGQLDYKTCGSERLHMNGDFVVLGYENSVYSAGYKGCDLRSWDTLPPSLVVKSLGLADTFRTVHPNIPLWELNGRVLMLSTNNEFHYFDLATDKLLSKFNAGLGPRDIIHGYLHQDKFFWLKRNDGRFLSIDYFAIPTNMDVKSANIQIDCGPRTPNSYGSIVTFCGDSVLVAAYGKSGLIFDFVKKVQTETCPALEFARAYVLSDSFVFGLGQKLQILRRGLGTLQILKEIVFESPLIGQAMRCFDDGRLVINFDSKVVLYDFGVETLPTVKPVTAILWKKEAMQNVTIDPNRLLQDAAFVLNIYDMTLRSFFAPLLGSTLGSGAHLVLVLVGTARANRKDIKDAFWRGKVTTETTVELPSSSFTKTHKRGGPPPKVKETLASGPALASPNPSIPMIVLKRQNDVFLDFPSPTDATERQTLAAHLGSFIQ